MDKAYINYRLRYESFSKFASEANKCSSVEEVIEKIVINYKYLINANFLRIKYKFSFDHHSLESTIYRGQSQIQWHEHENKVLTKEEQTILENEISKEVAPPDSIKEEYPRIQRTHYHPLKNTNDLLLLIITGSTKNIQLDDSDFLFVKLLGDFLENKFYQLSILNKLKEQNQELVEAYSEIEKQKEKVEEKNSKIETLVKSQEQTIKERTQDLKERKDQLYEYAFLNHHEIRGPVSTLLGLVDLIADEEIPENLEPYISKLQTVTKSLDESILKAGEVLNKDKNK